MRDRRSQPLVSRDGCERSSPSSTIIHATSPALHQHVHAYRACEETKRGRAKQLHRATTTRHKLTSLLFVDVEPPTCFVTEVLKVPNVPRSLGRWGPALFVALATYLVDERDDICTVDLITRHQGEHDGTPFQSTVAARNLFAQLGFTTVQAFHVGFPRRTKLQRMLYELKPGQAYMSVNVRTLMQNVMALPRLNANTYVISQSPSIVNTPDPTWWEREAIDAIRAHHVQIQDGLEPQDVLPLPNTAARCFYGFHCQCAKVLAL